MPTQPFTFPIAVIGAGPVGLAAAAQLTERGLPFQVLEAGDGPAAAVRAWGHVRLFSPWRYNLDPAAARLRAQVEDAGTAAPRTEGPGRRPRLPAGRPGHPGPRDRRAKRCDPAVRRGTAAAAAPCRFRRHG